MKVRNWLILLLFTVNSPAALGDGSTRAIWWTRESRPSPFSGKKPSGAASHGTAKPMHARPHGKSGQEEPSQGVGHSPPKAMGNRHRASAGKPDAAKSGPGGGKMPSRAEIMAAMRKPKPVILRWGAFPTTESKDSALGKAISADQVTAWIRGPDGSITRAEVKAEKGTVVTECPPEAADGTEQPNGVYLVGMHLDAGVMDFDSDGKMERVHCYSNGLVTQFSRDGKDGDKPSVFFKEPERIALEIGPHSTESGRGGYFATTQKGMEENQLRVYYRGQPLANAKVSVLSNTGWKNEITTDEEGILTTVPVGKKSDGRMQMTPSDQCLYVVVHKEAKPGEHDGVAYESEYHCASLLMGVRMPRPEWESKARGFNLMAVSGMGFLVLFGTVAVYRRRRQAGQIMIQFDKHRISRGDA